MTLSLLCDIVHKRFCKRQVHWRSGLAHTYFETTVVVTAHDQAHSLDRLLSYYQEIGFKQHNLEALEFVWESADFSFNTDKTASVYTVCAENEVAKLREMKTLGVSKSDALSIASEC